jgi:chemotaxis-related protein WspB
MLMMVFHLGDDRFALPAGQVDEVVPLAPLRDVPRAPDYVAGLMDYRGRLLPVIDLCRFLLGRPARRHYSSRILVVTTPQRPEPFGLLAEHVTETLNCTADDMIPSGVTVDEAPYLGDLVRDMHGLIQCIQPDDLLDEKVRALLNAPAGEDRA